MVAGPHGLVPRREGAVVFWHAYDARPRQLTDVGEADRGLRQALLRTRTRSPPSTWPGGARRWPTS